MSDPQHASSPEQGSPAHPAAPPSRRPANWGSQPLGLWWILPVGLTLALVVLFAGHVRGFGYVVAGTLVVAALARLALPRSAVGGLLVRSRAWDVSTLLALAAGVAIISATLLIR